MPQKMTLGRIFGAIEHEYEGLEREILSLYVCGESARNILGRVGHDLTLDRVRDILDAFKDRCKEERSKAIVSCLRCDANFISADRRRNRICPRCSTGKIGSGKVFRAHSD